MRSITRVFALILLSAASSGCVMCQNCFDENFGFQGGSHPRAVSNRGRVGSLFQPAGATHSEAAHTEEIVETPDIPLLDASEGELPEPLHQDQSDMLLEENMPPQPNANMETRAYPRTEGRSWTPQRDYLQ